MLYGKDDQLFGSIKDNSIAPYKEDAYGEIVEINGENDFSKGMRNPSNSLPTEARYSFNPINGTVNQS